MSANFGKILQIEQDIYNNPEIDPFRYQVYSTSDYYEKKIQSINSKRPSEVEIVFNPLVQNNYIKVIDNVEKYDNISKKYVGNLLIRGKKLYNTNNFDPRNLIDILQSIKGNKYIYDNFKTSIFYPDNRFTHDKLLNNFTLTFAVNYEYNFLMKNYENYIKNINELNLPNFYEFLESATRENISDNITLPEDISAKLRDPNIFNTPEFFIDTNDSRDDLATIVFNSNLGNKKIENYLNSFIGFKEQFPMYTEISFTPHQKNSTSFSYFFDEKNLYDLFFNHIINNSAQETYNMTSNDPLLQEESLNYRQIKINNIKLQNNFLTELINNESINFIDLYEIENKINQKKNNIISILNNENCYSETIGYKLTKTKNSSIAPIQEWYLPNVFDQNINLIDTQVNYDTNYTYKLSPIVMVIGTEYKYSNISFKKNSPEEIDISIDYEYENIVKIFTIDTPQVSITDKILDTPPIKPEISFYPLIGVDNKIKILLNNAIGKYYDIPLAFNDEERRVIEQISNSQKNKPSFKLEIDDNKILYNSDDLPKRFQIFRLEQKPESYDDFINNFPTSLLVDIDVESLKAASADFLDTIKPNTKYWYTSRVIDYHNNFSNLTDVFEIEIINDKGTIYPVISYYDFEKNTQFTEKIKTFKRFIKIEPSAEQVTDLNVQNGEFNFRNNVDSIWNRNFKMTITSKSTGKKIDIYFKFDQEKGYVDPRDVIVT